MDQSAQSTSAAPTRAPLRLRALGLLIEPWIRIKREPAEPRNQYDLTQPVCYVTERYGLSDTLILEQACREAGLPEPLRPFEFAGLHKQRAMFALSRRDGWLFGRAALAHALRDAGATARCRARRRRSRRAVMPVTVLVGRAPDRRAAGSGFCSRKTGSWSDASAG